MDQTAFEAELSRGGYTQIETKVIETDLNNNDNLGIDWVLQASINGGSAPTSFPFTDMSCIGISAKSIVRSLPPHFALEILPLLPPA